MRYNDTSAENLLWAQGGRSNLIKVWGKNTEMRRYWRRNYKDYLSLTVRLARNAENHIPIGRGSPIGISIPKRYGYINFLDRFSRPVINKAYLDLILVLGQENNCEGCQQESRQQ